MIRGGRIVALVVQHHITRGDDPPGRHRVQDDVDSVGIGGIEGKWKGPARVDGGKSLASGPVKASHFGTVAERGVSLRVAYWL